jgi:hypothetical protein
MHRLKPFYEEQAKGRQKGGQGGVLLVEQIPQANEPSKSRDAAGKAAGVNGLNPCISSPNGQGVTTREAMAAMGISRSRLYQLERAGVAVRIEHGAGTSWDLVETVARREQFLADHRAKRRQPRGPYGPRKQVFKTPTGNCK